MTDYISREAEIQFFNDWVDDLDKQINDSVNYPHLRSDYKVCKTQLMDCIHAIKEMPAADVVARDCYDRILAENDTMREMLARIGKNCGDSMDDVRPVMHGKWMHGKETGREYLGDCLVGIFYDKWTCSECGYVVDDRTYSRINYSFCPHCGADMREPNLDATKRDNH